MNQERWDQSEVTNYRYSYNRLDIEGEFKADVVVTVTDGGIDSVTVQGQSVENPDRFLTIDELYDVILSAYDRDDRGSFNAAFNEDIYYPVRYRANAGESNPEEELVVLDFDPL